MTCPYCGYQSYLCGCNPQQVGPDWIGVLFSFIIWGFGILIVLALVVFLIAGLFDKSTVEKEREERGTVTSSQAWLR